MDRDTRNLLANTTQALRRGLEEEFALQLEGRFDVLRDGSIADAPGPQLDDSEKLTRRKIVEAIHHRRASGESEQESVDGFLRETAFTFLNRLAALKMMEARGIVQECVSACDSHGFNARGFKEFGGLAPGLIDIADGGYRLYLECIFDEIGREVGILFDRTDPASLLWPRRTALLDALGRINDPKLAGIWSEDETIGWIYQYYNDPEERRKMRDVKQGGSAAPRNSREMAVRNQFFTPRYVVEFLTDNALGRLWYEMTQGKTSLKDKCRYLIRRPNEIFLAPGEKAPEVSDEDKSAAENLSKEDQLKQPVFIQHRPLKDPRQIRMIDPACGSMHFGLYTFDLMLVIYEEAWDLGFCPELQCDYSAREEFMKDVPRLILEHNIHGVDIDPRAAQIAGLALWLRAQKAWQEQGLRPAERPTVTRSNIVCAEPMPGEEDLLLRFVERSFPSSERPFFTRLLGEIFKTMRLAGEAGSLLKIEDDVSALVADARAQWKKIGKRDGDFFSQAELVNLDRRSILQQSIDTGTWSLDALSGIPDSQFWEKAEERIYDALRAFAESAEGNYQRRLFADDAARGFAFIDLCRQRYDVALMNPPFGLPCESTVKWFRRNFKTANDSLYLAFDLATQSRLTESGFSGMICDRTFVYKTAFKNYRVEAIKSQRMSKFVDLGWGVLDANVEVCMFTSSPLQNTTEFYDLRKIEKKETFLLHGQPTTVACLKAFSSIPRSVFAYDLKLDTKESSGGDPLASDTAFTALVGVTPSEVDRVYRLRWEVPETEKGFENTWADLQAGSPYCPFYYHVCHVVRIDSGTWKTVLSRSTARVPAKNFYRKRGLSFGKRTDFIYSYPKQRDQVFSTEGQAFFPVGEFDVWMTLAITNSNYYQDLINKICGQHKHSGYLRNARLDTKGLPGNLGELARYAFSMLRKLDSQNELSPDFVSPLYEDMRELALSEIITSKLNHFAEVQEESAAHYRQISSTIDRHFGNEKSSDYNRIAKVDYFSILNGAPPCDRSVLEILLSYLVGASFGRWDLRFATGETPSPPEPDPFDPLPVCPPGMLQNAVGLPATPADVPADYPLRISSPGILVDDKGHDEDIETRVREVLAVVFPDRVDEIAHEACRILGVKTLREFFGKPSAFFAGHLTRYTKSTRKAPIYWPLSSPNGLYTLWLYYPRLTADTLFTALRDFLEPKLQYEEGRAFRVRQDAGPTPAPTQRAEIAEADELVDDLRALRDELKRVAPLFKPDLNDGVILNHAPLWRMIGLPKWRKDCQTTWEKLAAGDYDWAHLALHLWPERVIPKCATDRSLAIAHDLESTFWEEIPADELPTNQRGRTAKKAVKKAAKASTAILEDEDEETNLPAIDAPEQGTGKWRQREVPAEEIQQLIASRTSPAVKAALEALAAAPTSGGAKKNAKKGGKA